ncbi:MAG TPA: hypothetical protein VHF26_10595 [Trebonia sp.]|nr:hypothetical protein [Trebonia sp.]
MLGIAKLLLGADVARALEGLTGDDGWGLADQARRAGEWCGSTPGRGGAGHRDGWLGAANPDPRRPVRREF